MRQVSQTYKTLRTLKGSYYEIKVVQGLNEYTLQDIKSLEINFSLFTESGPQIGKVNSAQCELVVMESSDNWPRMAAFEIYLRLSSEDNETKSEWLNYGTFYTDERSEDDYGNLTIIGFDGVLLLEQVWADKIDPPTSWPITSQDWLNRVEAAGLIEVDSRSIIDNTVAFIGLNSEVSSSAEEDEEGEEEETPAASESASTIRSVLGDIAAAHGGNWQMTGEGKMRLIPFASMVDGDAAIAGLAIAGIAVVGNSNITITPGAEYIYLGMEMQDFTRGVPLSGISGVHLETRAGEITESGDDDGYVIYGECEFASTDGLAALALSKVEDYVYKPFDSGVAWLDPAAEVGDLIIVNGRSYQMMTVEWTMGKFPAATLSAPFDAEIDHEYTHVTEAGKTYQSLVQSQKEMKRVLTTRISQSSEAFEVFVGEVYPADKETTNGKIKNTDDKLKELGMHYRFTADGEIIGKTDSEKSIQLSNDGIDMMVNGESVTHFNQNELYAPRKVEIPVGGTLQLGNFIFQPRSSGNISLLWVGGDT